METGFQVLSMAGTGAPAIEDPALAAAVQALSMALPATARALAEGQASASSQLVASTIEIKVTTTVKDPDRETTRVQHLLRRLISNSTIK
jgi:hypothetical protein